MAGTVRDDGTFMFDRAAETMARGDLAALPEDLREASGDAENDAAAW